MVFAVACAGDGVIKLAGASAHPKITEWQFVCFRARSCLRADLLPAEI